MMLKGIKTGAQHHKTKPGELTPIEPREIEAQALVAAGTPRDLVARRYGVSVGTIARWCERVREARRAAARGAA